MSAVRRLWLGAVLSGCVGVAWAQGAETSSIQQGGTSADQRSVAIAAQRDGASATHGMEPMSARGAFALPGLFHSSDTDGLSIDKVSASYWHKVSASYWPNYQSGSQWQGVGDVVLGHAGRLIQGFFRLDDIACRYGGEEFCVLLRTSNAQAAMERAVLLVDEFNQHSISLPDGRELRISISIGVSERVFPGPLLKTIHHADVALYEAKSLGRNQAQLAVPVRS